ncbi:M48 family metalloprotease [Natronomonas gomsonensis]|uniref:M48 family metalloprotease n=1 Tax=Natronomonas gomsonensis TaxID=1046043 RepID=UPI0015BA6EFB|nr:M48 family metalloprotease [Natronomonas gomsonensis]
MSLALQFGSVIAFLAVTLPVYWVLSRLALRTSAPTVWLRRLLITLIPAAVSASLLFIAAGTDDAARNTVTGLLPESAPPAVSSLAGDVAAQFALFLSAASVTLAAYTVVVPAIRTARDIELSTWTAIRRAGRFALLLTVLLTVVFVPFRRIVMGEDLGVAPVTLILLVLLFPFVTSVLFRVFRSTRAPTQEERDRIEALCTRASLDVDDARILTDATETLEIHLRGLPGQQSLYVSASVLERFDDEPLSALLAVNGGSVAHHHRAIKVYSLLGFLVVGVATLAWGSTLGYVIIIGLALVGWLPVLWAARRAVRRGDDDAADRVGAATVADALERMATEQNLDIPSGGVGTIFKSRPPLGNRIDRLRKQDG